MRYTLEQPVLAEHPVIELDEARFNEVRDAVRGAFFALSMEEKLKIAVDNHIEFEELLLNMALRAAAYSNDDWSAAVDRIQAVNRRLSNLLSSVLMYIDHAKRGLPAVFGRDSVEKAAFKSANEAEKSASPLFSFALDLRDYVQHQGLAISPLSLAADRDSAGERYRYIPYIETATLRIKERGRLRPLPPGLEPFLTKDTRGRLDVRPIVREAVSALARIHKAAVGVYEDNIRAWQTTIRETISAYTDAGGEVLGLEVRSSDEAGSIVESFSVIEDPLERWHRLHARVIFYRYAKGIYVTNGTE